MARLGLAVFAPVAKHCVTGEQGNQQQCRPDGGKEQAAERLLRGDRIKDHGDRGRQQDTEGAAGRDDPGGETGRIAALSHLRNSG